MNISVEPMYYIQEYCTHFAGSRGTVGTARDAPDETVGE